MRTNHFIITRYNLPSEGVEARFRLASGWLEERTDLFEEMCIPSVSAQSCQDFRWIVYFDPDSPEWLKRRVCEWQASSILVAIYRASVPTATLLSDLAANCESSVGDFLLTSNLDNDDALALDFVERLQARASRVDHALAAFYFRNGLIKEAGQIRLFRSRHNAFVTVREPWPEAKTCWADWHNRIPKLMPVESILGKPGWLQVVHSRNVSNRSRGVLVNPRAYLSLFPGVLSDVPNRPRVLLAMRNTVSLPLQMLRELSRTAVKRFALIVWGKSGPDRLRDLWFRKTGQNNAQAPAMRKEY